MKDCPTCSQPVDGLRCSWCDAHATRGPAQQSIPDRGIPAPEKRARIRKFVGSPFQLRRDPVEHWRGVLATPGLSQISYRFAHEALAIIAPPERQSVCEPGADDDL